VFPLHDDNPTELFPLVTLLLMAACGAVWVFLQGAGLSPSALEGSICSLGAVPSEITGARSVGGPCPPGGSGRLGLLTSMFLHGSWFHLVGNLWFLWIFGNNVEDSMGHLPFVVFYLVSGVAASLAHVLLDPGSALPMVGASGAVAAVMGAYIVLYPRERVHTLFFFLVFFRVVPLPAWVLLGYWFLLQLLGSAAVPSQGGGIAYAAHVAGFLAGVALIPLFRDRTLVAAKRAGVVLGPDALAGRRWW